MSGSAPYNFRIRDQVEAVERALENEIGCADVLQLMASIRGAVNGLTAELIDDHIRLHVVDPVREPDPERAKGAEDLILIRTHPMNRRPKGRARGGIA